MGRPSLILGITISVNSLINAVIFFVVVAISAVHACILENTDSNPFTNLNLGDLGSDFSNDTAHFVTTDEWVLLCTEVVETTGAVRVADA